MESRMPKKGSLSEMVLMDGPSCTRFSLTCLLIPATVTAALTRASRSAGLVKYETTRSSWNALRSARIAELSLGAAGSEMANPSIRCGGHAQLSSSRNARISRSHVFACRYSQ